MRSEKPRIGITLSQVNGAESYRWPTRRDFDYVKHEYYQAVMLSGGTPILLANVEPASAMRALLDGINGLLLTGGGDIDSRNYGQNPRGNLSEITAARDHFELAAIQWALKRRVPILGICRGHQVLNVALGGTLFQDLSCVGRKTLEHFDPDQTGEVFHRVTIEKGSRLHKIIESSDIETNSGHHQVVDRLGKDLRAVAFTKDDIIEGIEHTRRDFVIGVQWHPEAIFRRVHCRRLFKAFIEAAAALRR